MARRRHGMSHLPIYLNWQTMIQRCVNPKHPKYPIYGARGITVCDRWRVFENFYADMGEKPSPAHSIDRQDNDRGYSPDNCRWATKREQVLNTRRSIAKRFRKIGEAIMADYDFTRCKAKLNPAKSISKMLKLRSAIGADTPAGHRISNLDEVRQNKAKAAGDPIRLAYLDASMERQLRDLDATRHSR